MENTVSFGRQIKHTLDHRMYKELKALELRTEVEDATGKN